MISYIEHKERKKSICTNCGRYGHILKSCRDPITSYGVINIKVNNQLDHENIKIKNKFTVKKTKIIRIISRKYPSVECYLNDDSSYYENKNLFKVDTASIRCTEDELYAFYHYNNQIMFMMVSRKFSLGFIEFVRGKYDVAAPKTIINLFEQMYEEEIKIIEKKTYDDILYHFLNRNNESREIVLNAVYEGRYSNEYCEAKMKFNLLKDRSSKQYVPLNLFFYTRKIKPRWNNPEWGFPKGRRDKHIENNLKCACREFEEETGYKKDYYHILDMIEPIEEIMIGTNNVKYKHVYYMSVDNRKDTEPIHDFDSYEIGEVRWFTFAEAMANIRPYHTRKKEILAKIHSFILNYLVNNCITFY